MRRKAPHNYLHVVLAMFFPLMVILLHGMVPDSLKIFNHELIKWDLPDAMKFNENYNIQAARVQDNMLKVLRNKAATKRTATLDTQKHRVLLIGDSQCDGLLYPLNNYCLANGHKLVGSVIWYSATVYNFSKSDTIQKLLNEVKPTYILLVLGLNEIYARDLKSRQIEAVKLIQRFGNTPYTWIGPAFWEQDLGIDTAYRNVMETGAYFSSKQLQLSRGEDKRHPDKSGYQIWFDQITTWLSQQSRYRLNLVKKPNNAGNYRFTGRLVTLHAAKYKGY